MSNFYFNKLKVVITIININNEFNNLLQNIYTKMLHMYIKKFNYCF